MPLIVATMLALANAGAGCFAHLNMTYYFQFRPYKACKTIMLNAFVFMFLVVSITGTIKRYDTVAATIDKACEKPLKKYGGFTGQKLLKD